VPARRGVMGVKGARWVWDGMEQDGNVEAGDRGGGSGDGRLGG
jgi:hypothetical protein